MKVCTLSNLPCCYGNSYLNLTKCNNPDPCPFEGYTLYKNKKVYICIK